MLPTRTMLATLLLLVASACAGRQRSSSDDGTPRAASAPSSSSVSVGPANGRSTAELFQGRFPGVQVFQDPSGGIRVRIRGSGTINASSDPLYIVDGHEMQNNPDGLLFINPADIMKIEVLRDVGSTSLYGVRGANGVVLITLRKHPR